MNTYIPEGYSPLLGIYDTQKAIGIMRELKCPLIVNQRRYSIFDRGIEDDGVLVSDKNGVQFKIPADNVILSTGYKSAPLFPKASNVYHVGDCSKVGNLRSVIWQAWDVCMKI